MQTPDRAVRIATDLVNTYQRGQEWLATPADLRRFLLAHAEPEPVEVTEAQLLAVREIRRRLRSVFGAVPPVAAATLNELLASYASRPYLSDHDGTPWHLHVTADDADWAQWLAASSAMGLAVVVAGYGFEALRGCAAPGCEAVFVTTGRRHIRRFCSQGCATRTRVSTHRARRRATDAP